MKKNLFLLIIIFLSSVLMGIFITQIYWLREAYSLKGDEFASTVRVALKGVVNQMVHYNMHHDKQDSSVMLMEKQDYLDDISTINPDLFDLNINEEFRSMRIGRGFEYAIIDKRNNTFILGKDNQHREQLIDSDHQINLRGFRDSDFIVLSAYFPDEKNIIFSRMVNWLILSLVFSSLLVLAFFYAILIFYRQKRLSEMKADFINNMTHEFKTPLATISLASEMLMKKSVSEDPSKIRKYVRIIYDENSRLQNHVEQILRVSLLEKGRFKLRKKETDIHELIGKILENFELTIRERNGDLKSHFCAAHHIVMGDPMHLTNMISNLLDNANKYSLKSPEIKVGTYNDSNGIIITVEDRGIGIDQENQRHIFKNLYRVPTGNIYNRSKGFGIGLYYVKTIVEAHGGHIKLKSEPGKGSRFDVYLPFISKYMSDDNEESQKAQHTAG